MTENGTKITGFVVDVEGDKVKVYLNNGKLSWYDQKTITDLFNVEKTDVQKRRARSV